MRRCSRLRAAPFASLTYSGYGHFDSDEFQGWIGEMGQKKTPYAAASPPRFASAQDEAAFKNAHNYGGPEYRPAAVRRRRTSISARCW